MEWANFQASHPSVVAIRHSESYQIMFASKDATNPADIMIELLNFVFYLSFLNFHIFILGDILKDS